jgi:hypothetical protein
MRFIIFLLIYFFKVLFIKYLFLKYYIHTVYHIYIYFLIKKNKILYIYTFFFFLNSVTVLCGELLREAEFLINQRIHPMTVIAGYIKFNIYNFFFFFFFYPNIHFIFFYCLIN